MKFRHIGIPLEGAVSASQAGSQTMLAIAWSSNSRKLAVCGKERIIYIFDENGEQRDKFPGRPADQKTSATTPRDANGVPTFKILSMEFSPDTTKLATAQSDGIVHVYKIGEGFKEKKSILGKLVQPRSVLSVIWGSELEIICGLLDGKLRHTPVSSMRQPRSKTFYDAGCPNVSLVSRTFGTIVAAGFVDGKIAVFSAGTGDVPILKYTIRHTCPAFALTFGGDTLLLAAGPDKLITVYNEKGKSIQTFDYSRTGNNGDREFGAACTSPNGQFIVVGGVNRLRRFRYVPRRKRWEEDGIQDVPNLQTITTLKWTEDGSKVALGTLNGSLHLFEASMKKAESDIYEIYFVNPLKAVINMKNSTDQVEITSKFNIEILDVNVLGDDQYAVASTMQSFIFCDIIRLLTSEIVWPDTEGNERFYFGNPSVCIVFNPGYFTLVEYGVNESLGSYRTELMNPHVISVRINERVSQRGQTNPTNKKLAYLMDLRTVTIVDLELSLTLGHVSHDSKIDWLELNETGSKLLYRDIKLRLNLLDVETMVKTRILTNCSFVQWVPGSDVVVAQSQIRLCIWYDINLPEQYVEKQTRGIAFNVVKEFKKTYVDIRESSKLGQIYLDESLIEFGTAMEDGDLVRAVMFLEVYTQGTEEERRLMWKQLQKRAMELGDLGIYERAAAGCNDVSKAKYIRDTLSVARSAIDDEVEANVIQNEVQARVSLLRNHVKAAEKAFLDNDDIESCISMYESIHKWQEAIRLASHSGHTLLPYLTENFLNHLFQSGQEELAADFLLSNGNYEVAVSAFLDSGIHTKAAKVIKNHYSEIEIQPQWIDMITNGLLKSDFYPEAAEFLSTIGRKEEALDCYIQAKLFGRAVHLAKEYFPHLVVDLEEEWGNHAFAARSFDEAALHFVESGQNKKALTAAIEARQFEKALSILDILEDPQTVEEDALKLASNFIKIGDFEKAEYCYENIGQIHKSIDMYIEQEYYDDAYRLARSNSALRKEVERTFIAKAEKLQAAGRFKVAEKVLTAIGEINRVINMYAKKKMYSEMLHLVEKHHPAHIESSQRHVAELLRKDRNYRSAENYYIKSGNYKEALKMYESIGQWEDAHRVARDHDGVNSNSAKRVIYLWADSLGGETGIRLIKRHNCIDGAAEFLCEMKKFEYAFDVASQGTRETLINTHLSYAQYCAENENYFEAQDHFLMGHAPKKAIDMFLNVHMIDEAVELAEEYGTRSEVQNILLTQAREAFDERDYKKFEEAILKAERPEVGITMYKDKGLWTEAFRLCKEYAPILLQELQDEYDKDNEDHQNNAGGETRFHTNEEIDLLLQQAKEFEKIGEYKHAIDCYMRLTPSNTQSIDFLISCWNRAGQLAHKFLERDMSVPIITKVSMFLREVKKYTEAAILCMDVEMFYEALDALIEGQLWDEARSAAKDFGLEYEQYVIKKHTVVLQNAGQVDELSHVNLNAALELLVEKGEWDKCLQKAKLNDDSLYHYMSIYIDHLLKTGDAEKVMKVYMDYGFPFVQIHFNLFKHLSHTCFLKYNLNDYDKWVQLRNICFPLVQRLEEKENGSALFQEFDTLLYIFHLHVNRAACANVPGLENIPLKISIALVRYTDILPAEKYFFDAGQMCKKAGLNSMAFVFLNHYMDIREATEDGKNNTHDLDYSAFIETDIPNTVPLTVRTLIPKKLHDETREWVLSASMDRTIQQVLDKNEKGDYVATLVSLRDGIRHPPCIISGYPVTSQKILFRGNNKCANKEDWNRFIVIAKGGQSERISEAYQFIVNWCGSNPNYSL